MGGSHDGSVLDESTDQTNFIRISETQIDSLRDENTRIQQLGRCLSLDDVSNFS